MRINFDVEMQVEQRTDSLYAATISPFNVTGYSDSPDGAILRVKDGVERLLSQYERDGNITRFLDETGVQYTIQQSHVAPTITAPRLVKSVTETLEYAGSH